MLAERRDSILSAALIAFVSLVGFGAFLYPLLLPVGAAGGVQGARNDDALLVFALLMVVSLAVVLAEMESGQGSSKKVALLGVLTAINAALRLADTGTAVLNVGGMSPIFFLIILVGYAYGPRFGFLLGAMTLLVSAVITGGMGPWLPYQMFAAGWVGLGAGWLPRSEEETGGRASHWRIVVLSAYGALSGIAYGALMNLFFWPYMVGAGPAAGLGDVIGRYLAYYLATSVWWDLARAVGNVVLIALLGRPTLRVLARFRARFTYDVIPTGSSEPVCRRPTAEWSGGP